MFYDVLCFLFHGFGNESTSRGRFEFEDTVDSVSHAVDSVADRDGLLDIIACLSVPGTDFPTPNSTLRVGAKDSSFVQKIHSFSFRRASNPINKILGVHEHLYPTQYLISYYLTF